METLRIDSRLINYIIPEVFFESIDKLHDELRELEYKYNFDNFLIKAWGYKNENIKNYFKFI